MADQAADEGAAMAEGLSSGEEERSAEGLEDNVTLSFLDKLKCMMYSKVERDAFLIEKLEKEEKKKAKKKECAEGDETKHKKKKPTVFEKLKSVFSTPEEEHEFLQKQVDEIQRKSLRQSANEEVQASGDGVATP